MFDCSLHKTGGFYLKGDQTTDLNGFEGKIKQLQKYHRQAINAFTL